MHTHTQKVTLCILHNICFLYVFTGVGRVFQKASMFVCREREVLKL